MPAQTSMLHIRIDDDLKERATKALDAMGLSTAEAVRLLFHRIVADQAFPLELKVPNAETQAAMAEADAFFSGAQKSEFDTADALLADIEIELLQERNRLVQRVRTVRGSLPRDFKFDRTEANQR
jgi:DNA-damage-inducible protein J